MKSSVLAAWISAVSFGFVAPLALAKVTPPAPPEAKSTSPAVKMPVIDFVEYDLPNGLHVILHRNTSAPVVATYLLYHVGSKNERADRTGFAHFFEHLMFEGTENIQRGQIDKLVSAAGGNLNASTSFDRTDYHFNLPANQLGLALWIESERMMHGKVEEVGVETQREVVKEERRLGTDNAPYGTLFENLSAMVFKGTPYEWTPIGSAQYIDKAKLEEFQAFYHRYYVPNNATLVVAGDFETEPTQKLIADYFGPIPRGKAIERPEFKFQPQREPTKKVVETVTTPLPAVVHAWRGFAETSADAPALEFLADILGTGRSSRLYERLVRAEQAATEVEVFPYFLEKAGVIGVSVIGNAGASLTNLDRLIDEEIAKVREKGVTPEELQKVKNLKLRELASSYGSMQSRARNLAHYHVIFGGTAKINHEWERYEGVTPEEIQRVAVKYLNPKGVNVLQYPVAK